MLYKDAKLLFEAERWSTSIGLSILACEEVGKFLILNSSLGTPFHSINSLRLHKDKQAEFSQHLRSILRIHALDEHFLAKGETDPIKRAIAGVVFLDKCASVMMYSNGSIDAVASDPELGPINTIIEHRVTNDPAYRLADRAALGQLDAIKQQAFYVDVKREVVSSPNQFLKEDASDYLRAAMIVTEMIAPEHRFGDGPVRLIHSVTELTWPR
jgi:hypothetical protein